MTPTTHRPCAVVPTFDNPDTVREVVLRLQTHGLPVVVVDDGSGPRGRAVVDGLADEGLALVERHVGNRGKGAAVSTGFARARREGYTHALQVDADLQHDLGDVPRFLRASRRFPQALILGTPQFDDDAPFGRRHGRRVSNFVSALTTGGWVADDLLFGFRVYPLVALDGLSAGPRMEFDMEIVVRLIWRGTPVLNVPSPVRYPAGGVSHYRLLRDNVRVARTHVRLVGEGLWRVPAAVVGGKALGRRLAPD